jgi:hypothetical protein
MEKLIKSESHGRCRGENKKKKRKKRDLFSKRKEKGVLLLYHLIRHFSIIIFP